MIKLAAFMTQSPLRAIPIWRTQRVKVRKEDNAVKTPLRPSPKELDVIFLASIEQKKLELLTRFTKEQNCFETSPIANRLEKDCEAKKRNDRILDVKYVGMKSVPHKSDGWLVPSQLLPKINCFNTLHQNCQGGNQCWRKGERFFNSQKVRVQHISCNYYS